MKPVLEVKIGRKIRGQNKAVDYLIYLVHVCPVGGRGKARRRASRSWEMKQELDDDIFESRAMDMATDVTV